MAALAEEEESSLAGFVSTKHPASTSDGAVYSGLGYQPNRIFVRHLRRATMITLHWVREGEEEEGGGRGGRKAKEEKGRGNGYAAG